MNGGNQRVNKMSLISKNFLSKAEYQKIADFYDLGSIKKLAKIKKGFEATKVIVTTNKGRFVVSLYKLVKKAEVIRKTKDSLNWEVQLANFFQELPVPHFLQSKNQRLIENYKRFKVTVCRFLPGKNPLTITPAKAYQLGKFLGEFHNQGKRFRKKCSARRKFYELSPRVMEKMNAYVIQQRHPLLKKVVEEVISGVKKYYPPSNLPQGPIHIDIKPENELFIGNKLTGVVDFGISYIGPYMIDVGKAIMWNCIKNGKVDKILLQNFLKGYKNKHQLTRLESDYLKNSVFYGIYSLLYIDFYHLPFKRVPLKYCLFLTRNFLPLANNLNKLKCF
ncbi:phosphotransferase [Patescibacteria group bacterium]|nr:phosphotransferase [Patescibacteria group bacterium]